MLKKSIDREGFIKNVVDWVDIQFILKLGFTNG